MKKSAILFCAALAASTVTANAQKPAWQPAPGHVTLPLWPNGAPGASSSAQPEIDTTKPTDNLIAGKPLVRLGNVSNPTLTVYSPKGSATRPSYLPAWSVASAPSQCCAKALSRSEISTREKAHSPSSVRATPETWKRAPRRSS